MYQFILLVHMFIAVLIVALVLVQQGKGATMGAAFGSGASQTIFGSRGSGSFLFKITLGLGVLFFATSIVLNNMATRAYKQQTAVGPLTQLTKQIETPAPINLPDTKKENKG